MLALVGCRWQDGDGDPFPDLEFPDPGDTVLGLTAAEQGDMEKVLGPDTNGDISSNGSSSSLAATGPDAELKLAVNRDRVWGALG